MKKQLTAVASALALALSLQAGQHSASLTEGPKQRELDRPSATQPERTGQERQHSMQLEQPKREPASTETPSASTTVRSPKPDQRQHSSQLRKSAG